MDASLYTILLHTHSVGRWVVLLLLLFAIINSLIAGNRPYIRTDNRLGLLLTISADLTGSIAETLTISENSVGATGGIERLGRACG